MPGIAGIFSAAPTTQIDLERMASCMLHESWYRAGNYSAPELGCHIAWTSHGGTHDEPKPTWNDTGDVCLVFSGEDFSDPRRSVPPAHAQSRKSADAPTLKYLLDAYEERGLSFIKHINGWFSGVLIDLRRRVAVLFNDRYGVSRIYWKQTENGLYFASEAKALLRLFPGSRSLDPAAVAESFSFGCVLRDKTLFNGLALMPPASLWTFGGSTKVNKETYFRPSEWEEQRTLDSDSFYNELRETVSRIMPLYLRGPERSAMSLTGGLDGRMIMSWADCAPGELPCYSFGGPIRDCQDVRIARQIAMQCGQSHTTLAVGGDCLSKFPDLAARTVYLSDGSMDVSGAVELFVNRLARKIAPVRITGNYGSEVLRGNVAFRPRQLTENMFEPEFCNHIRAAEDNYRSERQVRDLSFVAFKQVPWHHTARLSVEQSQLKLRSPYLDNDFVKLMYRAPESLLHSNDPSLRLIHDGNPALGKIPTDRGLIYGNSSLVSWHRKITQKLTAKAEYAFDYGMPQSLAHTVSLLEPLGIERIFLGRHKFCHFRKWYASELSPFVRETLLDSRSRERSFFRPGVLEKIVNAHLTGRGNYTLELHRALTLELTQSELFDRWRG